MENKPSVNKNAIYNTLKSIFGIIFPLITFPYISRVLMAENIGKINFGNSIVSYFSLIASLGVTTYAVRECSKVKDSREKLSEVSGQILSINIVTTIIAYVALAVILINARSLDNYRTLICIQSAVILFNTLGADWLNTAMEDFKFIAIRSLLMQIVSIVLMLVFVRRPENFMVYAVISVIAGSGANVVNIFYRKRYCSAKFNFNMQLKKHLPPILLLFSMILSQTIYCNSDMTMLGLLKGDFEVGLYSTSVKIYNIVNTVVASVAWVVMPQLSFHFTNKNYTEINRLLKYSLNYIIVLGIPCIVGINAIAPQIIEVIAGKEYIGAVLSLHILTISLAGSFVSGFIGNMIMLPSGREKICLKSSAISAVTNVVLNLILIPKFGLNAAAATTAFSEMIGIFIKLPYIEKEIKLDGLKEMILAPVVGAFGILIISAVTKFVLNNSWLIAGSTIFLSAAMYLAVLMITKNQFFMGFINPVIKKLKGENE